MVSVISLCLLLRRAAEAAADLAYSLFAQRLLLERPIARRRTLATLLHCDSQLVF